MEHDSKNTNPYKGIALQIFFMLFLPMLFFIVFMLVINHYQTKFPPFQNFLASLILSLIIGVLFMMILFVCGILKQPFKAVKERMAEFVQNVNLSFSFAVKCYFGDMSQTGVVFLIYMFIFIAEVVGLALSINSYITLYLN